MPPYSQNGSEQNHQFRSVLEVCKRGILSSVPPCSHQTATQVPSQREEKEQSGGYDYERKIRDRELSESPETSAVYAALTM